MRSLARTLGGVGRLGIWCVWSAPVLGGGTVGTIAALAVGAGVYGRDRAGASGRRRCAICSGCSAARERMTLRTAAVATGATPAARGVARASLAVALERVIDFAHAPAVRERALAVAGRSVESATAEASSRPAPRRSGSREGPHPGVPASALAHRQ